MYVCWKLPVRDHSVVNHSTIGMEGTTVTAVLSYTLRCILITTAMATATHVVATPAAIATLVWSLSCEFTAAARAASDVSRSWSSVGVTTLISTHKSLHEDTKTSARRETQKRLWTSELNKKMLAKLFDAQQAVDTIDDDT